MIRICIGNVGSGKTVNEVREMYLNTSQRTYYSNIQTNDVKNNVLINPEMIVKKEIVGEKKNKYLGTVEPIYKFKLNVDFWKKIKDPVNVIIDEAHSILNSRKSMSKVNVCITDWIALIRRVLGQSESGEGGQLILISQLPYRIDRICRDMATEIRYHLCHYYKTCKDCGIQWQENSNLPEVFWQCFGCKGRNIQKHGHSIEIWHFSNMTMYQNWEFFGAKSFYKHYMVYDIQDYFHLYKTLQWDNLFSTLY